MKEDDLIIITDVNFKTVFNFKDFNLFAIEQLLIGQTFVYLRNYFSIYKIINV